MNLTDHFLVAMPNLQDNFFTSSVVYVTRHTMMHGAVGVIINKPLGKKLKNAFADLDFSQYNPNWSENLLYLGGPVSSDNGFVLHRTSARQSNDDILFELTGNRDVLTEIAQSNNKNDLFVSVGYTAWGASQIEEEVCKNDWLVVKSDSSLIFDVDVDNRYNAALKQLGISDPSRLYYGEDIIA